MELLLSFLSAIEEDPRINTSHISLYVILWKKWKDSGSSGPLSFFRSDVIDHCKMSVNTFHKSIRQLNEYGYIQYTPSKNYLKGSKVRFIEGL